MALITEIAANQLRDRMDARFHVLHALLAKSTVPGLVTQPLGQLAHTIRRGQSPGRLGYYDAGIPILKSINIREGYLSLDKLAFVPKHYFDKKLSAQANPEDVLITSTGEGTIGRAALFLPKVYQLPFCLVTEKITIVRDLDHDQIDPDYLTAFLNSAVGTAQLIAYSRGSTGKIELYPHDIAKLLIPILPSKLQLSIAKNYRQSVLLRQRALTKSRSALQPIQRSFTVELTAPPPTSEEDD
jgi:hypothetical protein